MPFTIEPAQTIWSFGLEGVLLCILRVPKGSTIIGFEANHLLVQRPVLQTVEHTHYTGLRLTALRLSATFNDGMLDGKAFVGVLRLTERMDSYAVFVDANEVHAHNVTINVVGDVDPARIAKIFEEDIKKHAEEKSGA